VNLGRIRAALRLRRRLGPASDLQPGDTVRISLLTAEPSPSDPRFARFIDGDTIRAVRRVAEEQGVNIDYNLAARIADAVLRTT
jgi:hypothetical protein